MPKFCYKVFNQDNETLLAISDSSIIGKTFEEGDLRIEISKDFYSHKTCDEKDALKLLRSSTIVNAVGRRIIDLMIEESIINEKSIISISGVPHAQVVAMKV